ncbi:MAG TPA: hypothetical protein VMU18_10285 [Rhodoblastus sp.]|nr:hypothetical protein [Rhodoblastus sp.]
MSLGKKFCLILCLFLSAAPARAEDPVDLATLHLRADPQSVTISGISSGAFMAAQFAVAWSSLIKGVGLIAGGPYYCARTNSTGAVLTFGLLPTAVAVGPCMKGHAGPVSDFTAEADKLAAAGRIDPTDRLKSQKIYIFHGFNDKVVAPELGSLTRDFYQHYLGDAGRNALFYQTAVGAGHSFVVAQGAAAKDCAVNDRPYLDDCDYDQAGILLEHFYGRLTPPGGQALSATRKAFSQQPFIGDHAAPEEIGLADQGYVYVPESCKAGGCRLHVVLHGCLQNAGEFLPDGQAFLDGIGVNQWADRNRIVVLYPQTTSGDGSWWHGTWNGFWPSFYRAPFNPEACWDWWGYVNYNDDYVTRSGAQIAAIKRMVDALTKDGQATAPAAEPFDFKVIDASDVSAALAWTPAAGATSYEVFRAPRGGDFTSLGRTDSLSFVDDGLAPNSAYRWRIVAHSADGATLAQADDAHSTRQTPHCADPGTCAWRP